MKMKIQFPDEQVVRTEIENQLCEYFDFSKRLLRFWLDTDKDVGFEKSNLPIAVLSVALSMSVKACRQFRSVIELCERGEAADASIVARSMFETAMVIAFVLKPRFSPNEFDNTGKKKKSKKKMRPVVSKNLSRELRAALYLTRQAIDPAKFAERHRNRPGMKLEAKKRRKLVNSSGVITQYEKIIGTQWMSILMSPSTFTYSGLSISHLAQSLGAPFPKWYFTIYDPQSSHVHAVDSLHHMQLDGMATTTPRWQDTISDARVALLTSIAMFYTAIGLMNQYIKFGVILDTAMSGFSDEYHKLIKT